MTTPRVDTPMTGRESVLTLLTLVAGGISSLLIVAATTGGTGLAPMPVLFWGIDVPAAAIVAALWCYARRSGLDPANATDRGRCRAHHGTRCGARGQLSGSGVSVVGCWREPGLSGWLLVW